MKGRGSAWGCGGGAGLLGGSSGEVVKGGFREGREVVEVQKDN